jgi:uncharacterized SAM-binding protein YcdF (DUF218 family)
MRFLPATGRRRVLAAVVVTLVVFVVMTMQLFVFPATDPPGHVDAIIVLGGTGAPTERAGVLLASKGDAPLLYFSLRPGQVCRPFTVYIPEKVRGECFYANPQTTQGEARSIARLARTDHWHRILVVATTSQVSRARLRIDRCYAGTVLMYGVDTGGFWQWTYALAYEWRATIKALVWQRGC